MKIISRIQKRGATGQRGQVLILVVIVIAVASIIISSLMGFLSSGIKIGTDYANRASSLYAADAGIQDAMLQLHNQPNDNVPSTVSPTPQSYQLPDINGWQVSVSIWYQNYTTYKIVSTAADPAKNQQASITSYVNVISGAFSYALAALGDYESNPTSPGGNINLSHMDITPSGTGTADILANGLLNLDGSKNLDGSDGSNSITGTAWTKDITAKGSNTITGNAFYTGSVTGQSSLNITPQTGQLPSLPAIPDTYLNNTLVNPIYHETLYPVNQTNTVLAYGTANFSPSSGPAGTTVNVTGVGWAASETSLSVTVGDKSAVNNLIVTNGNLSGSFTVPSGLTAGSPLPITITGAKSGIQTFNNAFTLGTATATFSPTAGPTGTQVTITSGIGWAASDTISSVTVGGIIAAKSLSVNNGTLLGSFTVPSTSNDLIVITGSSSGPHYFYGAFTITPIGTINNITYGAAIYINGPLNLTGNNITFNQPVYVNGDITYNGNGTIIFKSSVYAKGISATSNGDAQNVTFNGLVYAGSDGINLTVNFNWNIFDPYSGIYTFNGPVVDLGNFAATGSIGTLNVPLNSTIYVGGNFNYTPVVSGSNLNFGKDAYVNGTFALLAAGQITGDHNIVIRGNKAGPNPIINLIGGTGDVPTKLIPFYIVPPGTATPAITSFPNSPTIQIVGVIANSVSAIIYAPTCDFSNYNATFGSASFKGTAICKSINFQGGDVTYPSDLNTRPNLPYPMVGGSSGGLTMMTYDIGNMVKMGSGTMATASFTPDQGYDGAIISVNGAGWADSDTITSVTVGGLTATKNLIVDNNGNLTGTITIPPLLGIGPTTIVINGTNSGVNNFNGLTILGAAPTVTSISLNYGPMGGGINVTIAGTNFAVGATVTIGGNQATKVNVTSPYTLSATTPAGTAGAQDVVVTTASGSGTLAGGYTYVPPPTVTGISPNIGALGGGTNVTITGIGFYGGGSSSAVTAVKFGSTAASYAVTSDKKITATSPGGSGIVDVTVTTTYGTSAISAADQFTYQGLPTVTGILPNTGSTNGGTSVTITGTNFTGVTAVKFGNNNNALSFTFISATQITATSPNGAGTQDIRVITSIGTSPTNSADKFTYVAAPTVTGISPSFGPPAGGTTGIIITGTGFYGGGSSSSVTAVYFGSKTASYTVNSNTQITATSPPGSLTVDVTVTTSVGGISATNPLDKFNYLFTATKYAGTGTNVPGVGTLAWTNFRNITAPDSNYATASVNRNVITNYLQGSNFGFSIPTNATITGITVVINRYSSGSSIPRIRDNVVSLVKGGVIQTGANTNKAATSTDWPSSIGTTTYGGIADLWGSTWTAADINASNFGVDLSVTNTNSSSRTASVDYMQITVYYNTP